MKIKFLVFLISIGFSSFAQEKAQEYYNQVVTKNNKTFFEIYNSGKNVRNLTIEYLNELLLISQENKNSLMEVYALEHLQHKYQILYKFDLAIEKNLQIISIANAMKSKKLSQEILIHTYNRIGIAFRRKLDAQHAIDFHDKALYLAAEYENPDRNILKNTSIARNSIAEIYRKLQQYKLAIEQLDKAIVIDKKINNLKGLYISYLCKGKCCGAMSFTHKSLNLYRKSLKIEISLGSVKGQVICYNRIANYYLERGKMAKSPELATSSYKKAMGEIRFVFERGVQLNNKYSAQVYGTLGIIQKYLGGTLLNKAELNLIKSCDIYESIDFIDPDYIVSCKELSDLYERKGSFKKAIKYLKKAEIEEEKTFGNQNVMYIESLISKHNEQANEITRHRLEIVTKQKEFETSKTRNILIITLITLVLLGVALYSVYRQGLLNNEKKMLLLEQQALQAQMNPHFVFNALNSIKLYIIKNEQKQAVYYLNKFSKLIRNILNTSKIKEISLKEELETMDLYVSIENIRFNNGITYKCIVENANIAIGTIKVPPLILQPFLENAIWHGLSSSEKDNKKVTLTVSAKSEELLEIRIKDNGVGRERSMAIKKAKTLKRKSIGIDLTERRLKTFSSDFITECYVKYIDILDDNANPGGTEVILGIPLK